MNKDVLNMYKNAFPDHVLDGIVKMYRNAVDYGENYGLFFSPYYGKNYRFADLTNYLKNNSFKKSKNQNICVVEVNIVLIDDDDYLGQIQNAFDIKYNNKSVNFFSDKFHDFLDKNKLVFIINCPAYTNKKNAIKLLEELRRLFTINHERICFVLFLELQISDELIEKIIAEYAYLFHRSKYYYVNTDDEIRHLVLFLLNKWNYQLGDKVVDYIVKMAGGIGRLAKMTVRLAIEQKVQEIDEFKLKVLSHKELKQKVELVLRMISKDKIKIMSKLVNNEKIDLRKYKMMLVKMSEQGYLSEADGSYHVRSMLIEQMLIKGSGGDRLKTLMAKNAVFSNRERKICKLMIEKINKIVSREDIISLISDDDDYSDWALDKAMSRLRKKLISLEGLLDCRLVTRKRKGYQLIVK